MSEQFTPTGGDTSSHAAEAAQTGQLGLSVDDLFSLLASHRRRYILYGLCLGGEGAVTRATLEKFVVVLERLLERESTGGLTHSEHVRLALHHVHLPVLANHGILEYGADEEVVRYQGSDRLITWVERVAYYELSWRP